MSDTYRFNCPTCGAERVAPRRIAGRRVRCAECDAMVTAPPPDEAVESEVETATAPDEPDEPATPEIAAEVDAGAASVAQAGTAQAGTVDVEQSAIPAATIPTVPMSSPAEPPVAATDAFDPYYKWLAIPPAEQPPNHYRLLGVPLFESDPDVIGISADRQMAHVKAQATGRHGQLSQKLLGELASASTCLLNPARKKAYDEKLRQSLDSKPVEAASSAPAVGSATTRPAEPEEYGFAPLEGEEDDLGFAPLEGEEPEEIAASVNTTSAPEATPRSEARSEATPNAEPKEKRHKKDGRKEEGGKNEQRRGNGTTEKADKKKSRWRGGDGVSTRQGKPAAAQGQAGAAPTPPSPAWTEPAWGDFTWGQPAQSSPSMPPQAAPPGGPAQPAAGRAPAVAGDDSEPPDDAPVSFRRDRENREAEMDMTPMVDVTFLLLIFFMVTAAFALQRSKQLPVPEENQPSTAAKSMEDFEEDPNVVIVRVDSFSTYHVVTPDWEQEAPSEQELLIKLREAREGGGGSPPSQLLVIANAEAVYHRVVTALDAGTAVGMEGIKLTTVEEDDE